MENTLDVYSSVMQICHQHYRDVNIIVEQHAITKLKQSYKR